MHSKLKGNIGQFNIASCFANHGFSVFTEEGDLSKIDLIAVKDSVILTIQVKAITPKKDKITLWLKKSGPGYQFNYEQNMFNFFAVYDLLNHQCYLINSDILNKNKTCFTFDVNAKQFLAETILRDYTGNS